MTSLSLDLVRGATESRESPKPVIGLLGATGPYGPLLLMQNVRRLTPAATELEHIQMIVGCTPVIPNQDRVDALDEESQFEALYEGCRRLSAWPVDAIVILIDSALNWHRRLQRKLKVPLLDIVEITVNRLKSVGRVRRAVVLSDDASPRVRIYEERLQQAEIDHCALSDSDQELVNRIIGSLRRNGKTQNCADEFADLGLRIQKKYGADSLVLASAELTEFNQHSIAGCVIVDSCEALASAVVDFAFHRRPLGFDVAKVRTFWDGRGRRLKDNSLGLLQAGMFTRNETEAEERWQIERREVSQLLAHVLRPGDEVLEPGCGTGRWSRELAHKGVHVVGFDACSEFIEVARDLEADVLRGPKIEYLIGGVADFHSDQRFDGIFVSGLLQYLSEPELAQFKTLVLDHSKPGSWLCIKQTVALNRHLELHGFFSETMEEEYSAIYRTEAEILKGLADRFTLIDTRLVFAPASDKPETCQKAFLLRRLD